MRKNTEDNITFDGSFLMRRPAQHQVAASLFRRQVEDHRVDQLLAVRIDEQDALTGDGVGQPVAQRVQHLPDLCLGSVVVEGLLEDANGVLAHDARDRLGRHLNFVPRLGQVVGDGFGELCARQRDDLDVEAFGAELQLGTYLRGNRKQIESTTRNVHEHRAPQIVHHCTHQFSGNR